MSAPSVTWTFTNGTTADATQVNTNFTDVINGLSDGTKDLTISAFTVGSTATFNGNVTLGNSTVDDITITGSIAATIPWKTNASGNIGSATLAPASVYLGLSTFTTRLMPGATASYTFTFPPTAGSQGDSPINNGSASMLFVPGSATDVRNIGIAATVGSNLLTITVSGAAAALSSTNPAYINFRSATALTGTPVVRAMTADATIVINNTATLGHTSAKAEPIYVYLCDDGGTIRVGVSSIYFDEAELQTSTQEGDAADAYDVLYTDGAAITAKAIRLIGKLVSTQASAGVWVTQPAKQALLPIHQRVPLSFVRLSNAAAGASGYGSSSTAIRLFATVEESYNVSSTGAFTYATSSTLGDTMTVNVAGVYAISYSDQDTDGGDTNAMTIGITKNASTLTVAPSSLANSEILAIGTAHTRSVLGVVVTRACCSWTGYLRQGDVIRPQAAPANGANAGWFSMCRIF